MVDQLCALARSGEGVLAESDMRQMLFEPTGEARTSQRLDDADASATPPTKRNLLLTVASCAPTRQPLPRPAYHLEQPFVGIIKGLSAWSTATADELLSAVPDAPKLPPARTTPP